MIIDSQTNFLWLADSLPKKYPGFFQRFLKLLFDCNVQYQLLPGTKDVWAVDYMPIQINESKYLRFVYDPSYLQFKKYLKTISDVDMICEEIGIDAEKSSIVIDGGNVTKAKDKVIMTDRIFQDNPTIERKKLLNQLRELLEVDQLYLVPEQPKDFTGHSDGMVRFVDDDTLIINDYSREKPEFSRAFEIAIHNIGLEYIKLPYNPYGNKSYNQANGDYINFLRMENILIVPVYGIEEDETAVELLCQVFKGCKIAAIKSNEIAKHGGVLNCISWNIKSDLCNQKITGIAL